MNAADTPDAPTALIAEDEPLLTQALATALSRVWPELRIAATVGDGLSAVRRALALRPDVLFFDIRMPGLDGLDAAAAVAEDWPDGVPLPALVFVSAYDQHAIAAFEAQAVDYLLKPVQDDRLQKTVARVQAALRARRTGAAADATDDATLAPLRHLLAAGTAPDTGGVRPPPLRLIAASLPGAAGQAVRMVPIDEVLAFEAADKYLRVLTDGREYLIRTPLRELLPQLDPAAFWQIHRGTLVRAAAIDTVVRDDAGKLRLTVRGLPGERFGVSRLYAHLFKAM